MSVAPPMQPRDVALIANSVYAQSRERLKNKRKPKCG
jgi:hypothetical protein